MPSEATTVFRLHPAINFARLGTSDDYYLSPETSAGLPTRDGGDIVGGLPIKCGTENEPITSGDLRDDDGNLKRQAARYRIFAYTFESKKSPDTYPNGGGIEILPGSTLHDGRTVKDVVWTVHLANKKANAYNVVNTQGVHAYGPNKVPQIRNPEEYGDPDLLDEQNKDASLLDPQTRVRKLVIDPGPRSIKSSDRDKVVRFSFDAKTPASFSDRQGGIGTQTDYPKSYPQQAFPDDPLFQPSGPLDSLGELTTDAKGHLLVLPGKGRTAAWHDEYGQPMPLTGDLNNGGWFDDAADGPVSATIVFEDGDGPPVEAAGAWVVCTDPAYAPQIRNVVSVWDDVYDTWVRELDLQPRIYKKGEKGEEGRYLDDYQPSFHADIHPIFRAAALQRWTANLPELAVKAHHAVEQIKADAKPEETIMAGLAYIRNPKEPAELNVGVPLMPLSLGDAGQAFLTVSKTQYFFLEQWNKGIIDATEGAELGPGEYLDMAALSNCLGGRYVPGIEVSHVIRRPEMYERHWRTTHCGPFRVKYTYDPTRYEQLQRDRRGRPKPVLTVGWLPFSDNDGLEPGDISKFMAIPWQTDYNSCSIHQTKINTAGRNTTYGNDLTLYWSWPSQRPDAVYPATDVIAGVLPDQVWSIRGPGTLTTDPNTTATFQDPLDSVKKWNRIGIVVQGTRITGDKDYPAEDYPGDFYLEVHSQLPTAGQSVNVVPDWPFNADDPHHDPGSG
jgi:hypothetical protein